jgi:hypothetical protein
MRYKRGTEHSVPSIEINLALKSITFDIKIFCKQLPNFSLRTGFSSTSFLQMKQTLRAVFIAKHNQKISKKKIRQYRWVTCNKIITYRLGTSCSSCYHLFFNATGTSTQFPDSIKRSKYILSKSSTSSHD